MKNKVDVLILALSIFSLSLLLPILILYSYNARSLIESGVGFLILGAASIFLWRKFHQPGRNDAREIPARIKQAGLLTGVLWTVEISINNFIAPPLPARDIIDNLFWAAVALSILVFCIREAYRANSMTWVLKTGAWIGFLSGLVACATALSLIVFAMPFITADPLNIAEWAAQKARSSAPKMAAYFAYETYAGAFLHLIVLGVGMGGFIGFLGGAAGKIARRFL